VRVLTVCSWAASVEQVMSIARWSVCGIEEFERIVSFWGESERL